MLIPALDSSRRIAPPQFVELLSESERGQMRPTEIQARLERLAANNELMDFFSRMAPMLTAVGVALLLSLIGVDRRIAGPFIIGTLIAAMLLLNVIAFWRWRTTGHCDAKPPDVAYELAHVAEVVASRATRIIEPNASDGVLVWVAIKGRFELKMDTIAEVGLFRVDKENGLLLFEGNDCRLRIPESAIIDCKPLQAGFFPAVAIVTVRDAETGNDDEIAFRPRCDIQGYPLAIGSHESAIRLCDRIRALRIPIAS